MIRIMDIWQKLIPENPSASYGYSKEDITLIGNVKTSIIEFRKNMLDYTNHLLTYLKDLK